MISVLQDGDPGGRQQRTVGVETRGGIDNVVDVPLARRFGCVDQRRVLLVDAAGLSVPVRVVEVAVQDLHFIKALQENSAVAAQVAGVRYVFGRTPFDMELAIPEIAFGLDISAFGLDDHIAVLDGPCRG